MRWFGAKPLGQRLPVRNSPRDLLSIDAFCPSLGQCGLLSINALPVSADPGVPYDQIVLHSVRDI